jgi:glycosyltransferase involved in cell wall biosynthesis
MREPASRERMTEARPDICLVCPFDLERVSGTPLRALATLEALQHHADVRVLATSNAHGAESLGDVWSADGKHLALRRFWGRAAVRLRRLRPRVAHCFTPPALPAAVLARSLVRGMRIVLDYHGPAEFEMARAGRRARVFFTKLDGWALRHTDAILAMSTNQRTYIGARYAPRAPVWVSWGPVDLNRVIARPPPVRDAPIFGYFGNANFWQGLDELLSAAKNVGDVAGSLRLVGVSKEDLAGGLPPSVEVIDHLGRHAMLEAMQDCDVLVSPRRGGPVADLQYPFKLSAYLAAGRPVIGTDVNDQGTIIRDAGCGITVRPGSSDEIAEAMRELASRSRAELAELGRRARAFAEQFLGYDALREQLATAYGFPLRER